MEELKLQLYLCEFWDWRKKVFHAPLTLEIAPGLNPRLFFPSGHAGNLFYFASFRELKEGMESRNEVWVGLCVMITGHEMKGMSKNMLFRISKMIDFVHIYFYKQEQQIYFK